MGGASAGTGGGDLAGHFPARIGWDQPPNGDLEWVFAFNRLTFLVTLAQAWQVSRNAKYAQAAAGLLTALLEGSPDFPAALRAWRWRLNRALSPKRCGGRR